MQSKPGREQKVPDLVEKFTVYLLDSKNFTMQEEEIEVRQKKFSKKFTGNNNCSEMVCSSAHQKFKATAQKNLEKKHL